MRERGFEGFRGAVAKDGERGSSEFFSLFLSINVVLRKDRIGIFSERRGLAILAGEIGSVAALSSTFAFSFVGRSSRLGTERSEQLSHTTDARKVARFRLVPSRAAPPFFRDLALFASGRHHLSFCQLGDFNLLSFCTITGPTARAKLYLIVIDC